MDDKHWNIVPTEDTLAVAQKGESRSSYFPDVG
jgi:hypothetical protein